MTTKATPLSERPAWKALAAHAETIQTQHLRQMFADDPERGTRFTAEFGGIFLDYSKNRITGETLALLMDLAEQSGLMDRVEAMFTGEKINTTENRAVLHVALRPRRASGFWSMAKIRFHWFMPCWTRCSGLPIGCAVESGRVRRGRRSRTL